MKSSIASIRRRVTTSHNAANRAWHRCQPATSSWSLASSNSLPTLSPLYKDPLLQLGAAVEAATSMSASTSSEYLRGIESFVDSGEGTYTRDNSVRAARLSLVTPLVLSLLRAPVVHNDVQLLQQVATVLCEIAAGSSESLNSSVAADDGVNDTSNDLREECAHSPVQAMVQVVERLEDFLSSATNNTSNKDEPSDAVVAQLQQVKLLALAVTGRPIAGPEEEENVIDQEEDHDELLDVGEQDDIALAALDNEDVDHDHGNPQPAAPVSTPNHLSPQVINVVLSKAHPSLIHLVLESNRYDGVVVAPTGSIDEAVLAIHKQQSRELLDKVLGHWGALLQNDCFFARSTFNEMHQQLLGLLNSTRLPVADSKQAEQLDQLRSSAAKRQRSTITSLLGKTSRVYGRAGQGPSFARVHDCLFHQGTNGEGRHLRCSLLFGNNETNGDGLLAPPDYFQRLIGVQLDFAVTYTPGWRTAEQQWDRVLRFGHEALEALGQRTKEQLQRLKTTFSRAEANRLRAKIFSDAAEVENQLWVIIFKAAQTIDNNSVGGFGSGIGTKVLATYKLFANVGRRRPIDSSSLAQAIRVFGEDVVNLVDQAAEVAEHQQQDSVDDNRCDLTSPSEQLSVRKKQLVEDIKWLLSDCVDHQELQVLPDGADAITALLSHVAAVDDLELNQLGATLVEWLQDQQTHSLLEKNDVAGRKEVLPPTRIGPLRLVMEKLNLCDVTPFWWTCGCGGTNPAEAVQCYACFRRAPSAPAHTTNKKASPPIFVCRDCHTPCSIVGEGNGCVQCGASHPRVVGAETVGLRICEGCSIVFQPSSSQDQGKLCSGCTAVSHIVRQQGGNSTAMQQQTSSTTCYRCGSLVVAGSPVCMRCGAVLDTNEKKQEQHSTLSLWSCQAAGCSAYNFSASPECIVCRAPRPSLSYLEVEYHSWRCGCGATNPGTQAHCNQCTTIKGGDGSECAGVVSQVFTCAGCGKTSASGKINHRVLAEGMPEKLKVTHCSHCSALHPRSAQHLASPSLPRPCIACGEAFTPQRPGSSGHHQCPHCDTAQSLASPHIAFRCGHCGERNASGFKCHKCHTLRPEVPNDDRVFVWKCQHGGVEGGGALSVEDAVEGKEFCPSGCQTWNFSWETSCRACSAPRSQHSAETTVGDVGGAAQKYEEIRARYLPWTCTSCDALHPATSLQFCRHCEDGVHDEPPPCPKCGERHVALECPTEAELTSALELLMTLEVNALAEDPDSKY